MDIHKYTIFNNIIKLVQNYDKDATINLFGSYPVLSNIAKDLKSGVPYNIMRNHGSLLNLYNIMLMDDVDDLDDFLNLYLLPG